MSVITQAELDDWLINKTIIKVDRDEGVLAIDLDDGSVLLVYTEMIVKGLKNG